MKTGLEKKDVDLSWHFGNHINLYRQENISSIDRKTKTRTDTVKFYMFIFLMLIANWITP